MSKGKLIIISGFSGTGKSTIATSLVHNNKNLFALSISATTRAIRNGEVEGVSYFFKSKEEFEKMIQNNELLEYANYVGNYYGTPKKYVDQKLSEGINVVLEIEIQGATQVKKLYNDAITVFITTKDLGTLLNRLTTRGTNSKEDIIHRIQRATEEAKGIELYDYIIINDNIDDSIKKIQQIVLDNDKTNSYENNVHIIKNIEKEMRGYLND